MTTLKVSRLARLVLNVADMDRACGFYVDALGFERSGTGASGRVCLKLGAEEILLAQASPDADLYPTPRAANDPWFQHFAIAVADMDAAYARLRPHVSEPISLDGPVRLPPSTGAVTAYKFRDPDGHPLELSYAPGSAWARAAAPGGSLFQGVDHTALAVSDLEASVAFYMALGLRPGGRFLNHGMEQDRLDGLEDVELDIAVLFTDGPGPHLELLHYRQPAHQPACSIDQKDVAAARSVFKRSDRAQDMSHERDPDGHRLTFEPEASDA